MSDAVGGPAERARRVQQRVDEFLSVPRAVSAAAVVYSVLAMFFWADAEVPYLVRLFGALTAFATIPPAWVSAAHGRWSASTFAAAALLLVQVLFFGYEYSWRPSPFGPGVLRDALTVIAACTALVVVATAAGWIGSARAVIAATLLAAGLIAVSGVDHWRRSGPKRESGGPLASDKDRRTPHDPRDPGAQALGPPARPRPPLREHEWSYSASKSDPVLEHRIVPRASIKTYYPSNPRGTFDAEPDAETLDMRSVRLFSQDAETVATLQPASSRCSPVQVRIDATPKSDPWSVVLVHRAALEPGGKYVVLAKVRADRPRLVGVQALEHADSAPAPAALGLRRFSVDERWSIVSLAVRVPPSVDRLLVRLLLGESTGAVEVAWTALCRARDGGLGRQDLRGFGPSAPIDPVRVVEAWADRLVVDVSPGEAAGKLNAASVRGGDAAASPGQTYEARFRVRSETEGAIGMRWTDGEPQARPISVVAEASLKPGWQKVRLEWTATAAASHASTEILLGAVRGRVEIADLVVTRKGEAAADAPISYQLSPWAYSVLHRMNADGYRDSDWPRDPPENTFRIALLGDSYAFGQGVQAEDIFAALVEERLNAASGGGPRFDVMNFGVCGYSTRQERLLYEHVASKFRPDLVLVAMHHNDNMSHREETEYYRRRKQAEEGGLLSLPGRLFGEAVGKPDHKVCADELLTLLDRCRRDGVPLAVCAFRNGAGSDWNSLLHAVEPAMRSAGVPFKDLGEELMQGRDWIELAVHELDGHPNELAHRIAARSIVDWLVANRLVPIPPDRLRAAEPDRRESP